ncbi:MAG: DUF4019 domain-containing protein [Acidobacteria bacterium]|nr:DUF4019 domain-containing protein [Acidobacteriota bacterium]
MLNRRTFCLALGGAPLALAAESIDQKGARQAAETWLALIDGGDYAASWETAASPFRQRVPKDRWEQMAGQVRQPLGAVESRQLAGSQPTTSAPGAPDGEYVILEYKTAFAHKKQAVERITPMKDSDGSWRVAGYFIR